MKEKFKILNGLPVDGSIPSQFSASGQVTYSEGFVVEFRPEGKELWVGNFQLGFTLFSDVISHPNNKDIIVIAGGQVYVIDLLSKQLIQVLDGLVQGVLLVDEKSLLIFNNNFHLSALSEEGFLWKTRRLSIDGIQNLKYDKNLIFGEGLALNDSWFSFQININDGKVFDERKLQEYVPLK